MPTNAQKEVTGPVGLDQENTSRLGRLASTAPAGHKDRTDHPAPKAPEGHKDRTDPPALTAPAGHMSRLDRPVYLVGFMGCGKSTIARSLADALGYDTVFETDDEIVRAEGRPIPQIFEEAGEAGFRRIETAVLRRIAGDRPAVVSCGGGMVLRQENVELMRSSGTVVCLTARPETVLERVRHSDRPLLRGRMTVEGIVELMAVRDDYYKKAADLKVATDGKTVDELVREIIELLKKG